MVAVADDYNTNLNSNVFPDLALLEQAFGLPDGQGERCGLAGAGLSKTQDIALGEHDGDGLFLNGGRGGVPCGLDAGCVEAAVMSGMLAVQAITGKEPGLDEIVGYHHP